MVAWIQKMIIELKKKERIRAEKRVTEATSYETFWIAAAYMSWTR